MRCTPGVDATVAMGPGSATRTTYEFRLDNTTAMYVDAYGHGRRRGFRRLPNQKLVQAPSVAVWRAGASDARAAFLPGVEATGSGRTVLFAR